MDHLDRFAPGSKDVEDEVAELARVISSGGEVGGETTVVSGSVSLISDGLTSMSSPF